jgi:hypothetical protein
VPLVPQNLRQGLEKQALIRLVNDEIDRIERSPAPSPSGMRVALCECGRGRCVEQLLVPLEDVARVSAERFAFLVAPGHGQPELERPVRREPGYEVVVLLPEIQELAAELDI